MKRVGSTLPAKKLCRPKNDHDTAFFCRHFYAAKNMPPGNLTIPPPLCRPLHYAAPLDNAPCGVGRGHGQGCGYGRGCVAAHPPDGHGGGCGVEAAPQVPKAGF